MNLGTTHKFNNYQELLDSVCFPKHITSKDRTQEPS